MKNIGLKQVFEKKVEFIQINSKQKNFLLEGTLISRIISLNILNLILLANSFQSHLVLFFQKVFQGTFSVIMTEGNLSAYGGQGPYTLNVLQ